jgi:hypothetical protein
MGLTDWLGTFGRAQSLDLSSDLERGYEAGLLIQSLELEHYNDRPVRPELELRLPKGMQAQVLRRFRAALQVCRQSLEQLEPYRQELSGQEVRQIQLIESVVSRYDVKRKALPSLSRSPEILPRSLIGVVDQVRRQLDPEAEATVVAGFRRRRDSTLVSLRILLLLILVPILMAAIFFILEILPRIFFSLGVGNISGSPPEIRTSLISVCFEIYLQASCKLSSSISSAMLPSFHFRFRKQKRQCTAHLFVTSRTTRSLYRCIRFATGICISSDRGSSESSSFR